DGGVDRLAGFRLQAIFLVPDVVRRGLQRNIHDGITTCGWMGGWRTHCAHRLLTSRCGLAAPVDFYWNATASLALQPWRSLAAGMPLPPAPHPSPTTNDSPSRPP